ncbi:MAG: Imm26 family immunity protein [candidate division WOR-3 bacterium]
MSNGDSKVVIGPLIVHLPTATIPDFWLSHDLADLMGLESNSLAEEKLEGAVACLPMKIKNSVSLDHDSDFVTVHSNTAEGIVEMVKIILALAVNNSASRVDAEDMARFTSACEHCKAPARAKWARGDVFAVPLKNGSYGFGVVLEASETPLLGLLDICSQTSNVDSVALINTKIVSAQRVTPDLLDNGRWHIVGRRKRGVLGIICGGIRKLLRGGNPPSYVIGSGIFENLANAYHGIEPWNVMDEEDFFDKLLKIGVRRPASVILLNPKERLAYRVKRGWQ